MIIAKKVSFERCAGYIADNSGESISDNHQAMDKVKKIVGRIVAEQLTDRQREVAMLYFFEERNIPQIAQLLGVNKSTVSRTLARALQNINDRIRYYQLR